MNKNEKQTMAAYEAPKVEVIEVEVEKGFAGSLNGVTTTGYEEEVW